MGPYPCCQWPTQYGENFLPWLQKALKSSEAVISRKKYAEEFELTQMDIPRLEQELELARARRDEALLKINENLDKAKAANNTIRLKKN